MTRKLIHLTLSLEAARLVTDAAGVGTVLALKDDEHVTTALVGDGTYNGMFFPTDEVAKGSASLDKQPFNLDHSDRVEDEVGFVSNPQMFGSKLRAVVTLNPATAKYGVAKAHIDNRLAAGKAPEVSVGVLLELFDEGRADGAPVARNLVFDHLALVTRGACAPADGCGIGLKQETQMDPQAPPAPPAPEAPKAPACGCAEKFKADIDRLTKERDEANAGIVRLTLKLAEEPRRLALVAEAADYGAPVESSDTLACLEKKVTLAKAVAAKLAVTGPARHTKAKLGADSEVSVEDQAARLFSRA